jgi:hypothetical protein
MPQPGERREDCRNLRLDAPALPELGGDRRRIDRPGRGRKRCENGGALLEPALREARLLHGLEQVQGGGDLRALFGRRLLVGRTSKAGIW